MTTVMVPDFIINMYEDEVKKVVNQVIVHISERFEINKDEIIEGVEKNLEMKLNVVPDSELKVVITHKKPRAQINQETRCIARLKKGGLFYQCSCKRNEAYDMLCTRHGKATSLKHGTINDELPKENLKRRQRVY